MPMGTVARGEGGDGEPGGRRIQVLLVDDDEDLLAVTERYLRRELEAVEVVTERSAADALGRLDAEAVDCVVADYQMPEMDGLSFLEAVREEFADIPFVLFTGRGSEEVASEAISAGVDDYVQKTGTTEQFELLATRLETLVDRRRTREDLRRNEARFARLIEHSPTVTRTMTVDGTMTYVSPSAEDVLGYPAAELVGQDGFENMHPDDRHRVHEAVDRLARSPDAIDTVEYRYRHGDGSWHWVRSTGRNLLDDPAVEAFVVNTEDISERKAYEQELERQNERLEEFASAVSHDLRNPLNVVLGTAELAREDPTPADFERIEDAATRMDALIEDLLALARQGEVVGETQPVDLASLARRVWDRMETGTASLTVASVPGNLAGDPDRLEQLFGNLFANAVQHAGPDASVTVGATDEGFYVADDGPGVPASERTAVFERGYTTSAEGTGFGLAIVRRIVEAHGWAIDVTDGEAGGARFEVTGVDVEDA